MPPTGVERMDTDVKRVGPEGHGGVIACVGDGPGAHRAAEVAESLVRTGSRLLLATVLPDGPRQLDGFGHSPELVRRGRALLARVALGLTSPAELRVMFGEPAARLIALVHREPPEFIVISAPEPPGTPTPLLGSVYLALAGSGPCPLVIVPRELGTDVGPIVCGIDGSRAALAAARVALDLANRFDAELRFVYVDEPDPPADRLAEIAESASARFVIVGSRSASPQCLIGSVSARLASITTRPLVIVPAPAPRAATPRPVALAARRLRAGAVVWPWGEIDIATAPELECEASRLLEEADGRLVIDLSDTTFMDVSGVRVLERLAQRATELGGSLVLASVPPHVRRLFDLVSPAQRGIDAVQERSRSRPTAPTRPLSR